MFGSVDVVVGITVVFPLFVAVVFSLFAAVVFAGVGGGDGGGCGVDEVIIGVVYVAVGGGFVVDGAVVGFESFDL